jgi:hypothetical protein
MHVSTAMEEQPPMPPECDREGFAARTDWNNSWPRFVERTSFARELRSGAGHTRLLSIMPFESAPDWS